MENKILLVASSSEFLGQNISYASAIINKDTLSISSGVMQGGSKNFGLLCGIYCSLADAGRILLINPGVYDQINVLTPSTSCMMWISAEMLYPKVVADQVMVMLIRDQIELLTRLGYIKNHVILESDVVNDPSRYLPLCDKICKTIIRLPNADSSTIETFVRANAVSWKGENQLYGLKNLEVLVNEIPSTMQAVINWERMHPDERALDTTEVDLGRSEHDRKRDYRG